MVSALRDAIEAWAGPDKQRDTTTSTSKPFHNAHSEQKVAETEWAVSENGAKTVNPTGLFSCQ